LEGYDTEILPSSYISGLNNISNAYYLFNSPLPDIVSYANIDKANFLYSVPKLNAFSAPSYIGTAYFSYNAPKINFNRVSNFLQSTLFCNSNSLTYTEQASLLSDNLRVNFKMPKVGKVYTLHKALC